MPKKKAEIMEALRIFLTEELGLVRSHGGYCYPETKEKIAEMVKADRDRAEKVNK